MSRLRTHIWAEPKTAPLLRNTCVRSRIMARILRVSRPEILRSPSDGLSVGRAGWLPPQQMTTLPIVALAGAFSPSSPVAVIFFTGGVVRSSAEVLLSGPDFARSRPRGRALAPREITVLACAGISSWDRRLPQAVPLDDSFCQGRRTSDDAVSAVIRAVLSGFSRGGGFAGLGCVRGLQCVSLHLLWYFIGGKRRAPEVSLRVADTESA